MHSPYNTKENRELITLEETNGSKIDYLFRANEVDPISARIVYHSFSKENFIKNSSVVFQNVNNDFFTICNEFESVAFSDKNNKPFLQRGKRYRLAYTEKGYYLISRSQVVLATITNVLSMKPVELDYFFDKRPRFKFIKDLGDFYPLANVSLNTLEKHNLYSPEDLFHYLTGFESKKLSLHFFKLFGFSFLVTMTSLFSNSVKEYESFFNDTVYRLTDENIVFHQYLKNRFNIGEQERFIIEQAYPLFHILGIPVDFGWSIAELQAHLIEAQETVTQALSEHNQTPVAPSDIYIPFVESTVYDDKIRLLPNTFKELIKHYLKGSIKYNSLRRCIEGESILIQYDESYLAEIRVNSRGYWICINDLPEHQNRELEATLTRVNSTINQFKEYELIESLDDLPF